MTKGIYLSVPINKYNDIMLFYLTAEVFSGKLFERDFEIIFKNEKIKNKSIKYMHNSSEYSCKLDGTFYMPNGVRLTLKVEKE